MSFGGDVTKWADVTKKGISKVYRRSAFDLFSAVIFMTPVKQGTLRNNWFASIGAISSETTGAAAPIGTATVARVKTVVNSAELGTALYLTNNLPYAIPIEYNGHSAKAINGMVRVNALRWESIVANNVRKFGV